ncbi:hypothetical protein AB0D04_31850 [Streptomyces sp. NPDC048483]
MAAEPVRARRLTDQEGQAAEFTGEVSDPRYLEHCTKGTYFQTVFTGHLP